MAKLAFPIVIGPVGSTRPAEGGWHLRGWHRLALLIFFGMLVSPAPAWGQLDTEHRQLLQAGYNQPLIEDGPLAAYLFYYYNNPSFPKTNMTLRMALAPTYLNSELGIRDLIGHHTDLGLGLSGGAYADNYYEVYQGNYVRQESFIGYSGGASVSIYHLFNPLPAGEKPSRITEVPLQGVLRNSGQFVAYAPSDDTASNFQVPDDKLSYNLRAGLRWGGREPMLSPAAAVELSVWYEGQFRSHGQTYGYDNELTVEPQVHLFWGRALVAWTFENHHRVEASITAGTSINADRLSAYRLGAGLPLASEFPLMIPGYYWQELSAKQFGLLSGNYSMPIGRQWEFIILGSISGVDYLEGMAQPGRRNSGVAGGIAWTSPNQAFHVLGGYAYGFNAIRNDGRGGQNITILFQWDVERSQLKLPDAERVRYWLNPTHWRGVDRLFGG